MKLKNLIWKEKKIFLTIAIIFFIALSVFTFPLIIKNIALNIYNEPNRDITLIPDDILIKQKKNIEKRIRDLDIRLSYKIPWSYYLIINSSKNEFSLYKGKKLVTTGKCSTGSYILLEHTDIDKWLFKTPKGVFSIHGKTTNPVWKKPDWAFIEEGLPVPPPNHSSRFEYGVLGDYALSLGKGYLIHGTLYQRFLGLPVTHGCIRLNDKDLSLVYNSLDIGSKVFIY